jgi:mono/diheme cytochrome c family protein
LHSICALVTRRRKLIAAVSLIATAVVVTACGSQGISLDKGDKSNATVERGAHLFAQRCAGCHTLKQAGAQGSATSKKNRERVDGPNFDARKEQVDQVLYAIENGGFSGAIMPQNIVVGQDAKDVAAFLARYAGRSAKRPVGPADTKQPPGVTQPPAQ